MDKMLWMVYCGDGMSSSDELLFGPFDSQEHAYGWLRLRHREGEDEECFEGITMENHSILDVWPPEHGEYDIDVEGNG